MNFAPEIEEVLDAWSIAKSGFEAYRFNTCSRELIRQFSYVWLTMLLVYMLFGTASHLIKPHAYAAAQAIRNCLCRNKENELEEEDIPGSYQAVVKLSVQIQEETVNHFHVILTVVIFGCTVPPLLVLMPVATWFHLCALHWGQRKTQLPLAEGATGDTLADTTGAGSFGASLACMVNPTCTVQYFLKQLWCRCWCNNQRMFSICWCI